MAPPDLRPIRYRPIRPRRPGLLVPQFAPPTIYRALATAQPTLSAPELPALELTQQRPRKSPIAEALAATYEQEMLGVPKKEALPPEAARGAPAGQQALGAAVHALTVPAAFTGGYAHQLFTGWREVHEGAREQDIGKQLKGAARMLPPVTLALSIWEGVRRPGEFQPGDVLQRAARGEYQAPGAPDISDLRDIPGTNIWLYKEFDERAEDPFASDRARTAARWAKGAMEVGADIVLDPTTYVTFGVPSAARGVLVKGFTHTVKVQRGVVMGMASRPAREVAEKEVETIAEWAARKAVEGLPETAAPSVRESVAAQASRAARESYWKEPVETTVGHLLYHYGTDALRLVDEDVAKTFMGSLSKKELASLNQIRGGMRWFGQTIIGGARVRDALLPIYKTIDRLPALRAVSSTAFRVARRLSWGNMAGLRRALRRGEADIAEYYALRYIIRNARAKAAKIAYELGHFLEQTGIHRHDLERRRAILGFIEGDRRKVRDLVTEEEAAQLEVLRQTVDDLAKETRQVDEYREALEALRGYSAQVARRVLSPEELDTYSKMRSFTESAYQKAVEAGLDLPYRFDYNWPRRLTEHARQEISRGPGLRRAARLRTAFGRRALRTTADITDDPLESGARYIEDLASDIRDVQLIKGLEEHHNVFGAKLAEPAYELRLTQKGLKALHRAQELRGLLSQYSVQIVNTATSVFERTQSLREQIADLTQKILTEPYVTDRERYLFELYLGQLDETMGYVADRITTLGDDFIRRGDTAAGDELKDAFSRLGELSELKVRVGDEVIDLKEAVRVSARELHHRFRRTVQPDIDAMRGTLQALNRDVAALIGKGRKKGLLRHWRETAARLAKLPEPGRAVRFFTEEELEAASKKALQLIDRLLTGQKVNFDAVARDAKALFELWKATKKVASVAEDLAGVKGEMRTTFRDYLSWMREVARRAEQAAEVQRLRAAIVEEATPEELAARIDQLKAEFRDLISQAREVVGSPEMYREELRKRLAPLFKKEFEELYQKMIAQIIRKQIHADYEAQAKSPEFAKFLRREVIAPKLPNLHEGTDAAARSYAEAKSTQVARMKDLLIQAGIVEERLKQLWTQLEETSDAIFDLRVIRFDEIDPGAIDDMVRQVRDVLRRRVGLDLSEDDAREYMISVLPRSRVADIPRVRDRADIEEAIRSQVIDQIHPIAQRNTEISDELRGAGFEGAWLEALRRPLEERLRSDPAVLASLQQVYEILGRGARRLHMDAFTRKRAEQFRAAGIEELRATIRTLEEVQYDHTLAIGAALLADAPEVRHFLPRYGRFLLNLLDVGHGETNIFGITDRMASRLVDDWLERLRGQGLVPEDFDPVEHGLRFAGEDAASALAQNRAYLKLSGLTGYLEQLRDQTLREQFIGEFHEALRRAFAESDFAKAVREDIGVEAKMTATAEELAAIRKEFRMGVTQKQLGLLDEAIRALSAFAAEAVYQREEMMSRLRRLEEIRAEAQGRLAELPGLQRKAQLLRRAQARVDFLESQARPIEEIADVVRAQADEILDGYSAATRPHRERLEEIFGTTAAKAARTSATAQASLDDLRQLLGELAQEINHLATHKVEGSEKAKILADIYKQTKAGKIMGPLVDEALTYDAALMGYAQLVQRASRFPSYRNLAELVAELPGGGKEIRRVGIRTAGRGEAYAQASERLVSRPVFESIQAILEIGPAADTVFDTLMRWWKFGIVAIRPARYMRDFISNIVLILSSGAWLNPAQFLQDLYLVLTRRVEPEIIDAAKDVGLLLDLPGAYRLRYTGMSTFAIEELPGLAGKGPAARAARAVRTLQDVNEQFARLVLFRRLVLDGADPRWAAHMTQEALFNYSELTATERMLRRSVMPFYTWFKKNLARQFYLFSRAPGFYMYTTMAPTEISHRATEQEEEGPLPSWVMARLPIFISANKTVANIDIPQTDFVRAVGFLGQMADPSPFVDRAEAARAYLGASMGGPYIQLAQAITGQTFVRRLKPEERLEHAAGMVPGYPVVSRVFKPQPEGGREFNIENLIDMILVGRPRDVEALREQELQRRRHFWQLYRERPPEPERPKEEKLERRPLRRAVLEELRAGVPS